MPRTPASLNTTGAAMYIGVEDEVVPLPTGEASDSSVIHMREREDYMVVDRSAPDTMVQSMISDGPLDLSTVDHIYPTLSSGDTVDSEHESSTESGDYYEPEPLRWNSEWSSTRAVSRRANPADPGASIVLDRGLRNDTGDNNCFLNGVLQVLWHSEPFRRAMRSTRHHGCASGPQCLFCSLQELFSQFASGRATVLSPDQLRATLAVIYRRQGMFQMREMADAVEAFEAILNGMHMALCGSSDTCEPQCIAHDIFSMQTVEQSECTICHMTGEPRVSESFVLQLSASHLLETAMQPEFLGPLGLRSIKEAAGQPQVFGSVIKAASLGTSSCDACRRPALTSWSLLNEPKCLLMALNWPTAQVTHAGALADLISLLAPTVDLKDMFANVKEPRLYALRAIVCFWGSHYFAFLWSKLESAWMLFDDTVVRRIGTLEQCLQTITRNNYQPAVLAYQSADTLL